MKTSLQCIIGSFVQAREDILKNILVYNAKKLMMDKQNSKKILHNLQNDASSVQAGDVEQVIIKILFKIWENYIKLRISTKFCDDAPKYVTPILYARSIGIKMA